MSDMDPEMKKRVVDRLRVVYPHDTEEMLEATATKTVLGAATAFRLACEDLGRALQPVVDEWARRVRRISGLR
jgi:hypothetical protein